MLGVNSATESSHCDIPELSPDACSLISACGCGDIPDLSQITLCSYLSVWMW
jgi:hypothetical protein